MQIWHMEPYPIGDRRLPHHVFPPKIITPDQLQQLVGVIYYKVDLDDVAAMKKRLARLNQKKSDVLTIDETMPSLNQVLEDLYEPHGCDKDDMICMVLEVISCALPKLFFKGSMYCDIEVEEEEWIRMQLERGDLIIVPKGRTYRYTTTPKNFVRLQRFARRTEGNQG